MAASSHLLVVAALLATVAGACAPTPPLHETVGAEGGEVRLALARLGDGDVHFFSYRDGDRQVNFLVRTDGSGHLQTHLDACFSCYRYKRGFIVEDDEVVCIACRLSYRIDDETWDYIGACAPIPLRSKVDDDHLVIKKAALERAARYF